MTNEEAIKRIRDWNLDKDKMEVLTAAIPELKESEDEKVRKNCIHFLELQKKHHADTFEIEECITWLTSLKDTLNYLEKQKEQKTTWSEEDEEMFKCVISHLKYAVSMCWFENRRVFSQRMIDWLESLKDRCGSQNTWKPTEE